MKALGVILILCGLGLVLGYFGWALYSTESVTSWTGGSSTLMAMIIGGVLLTGALTGALMWLAFYSDRKGFDEPLHYEQEQPPQPPLPGRPGPEGP